VSASVVFYQPGLCAYIVGHAVLSVISCLWEPGIHHIQQFSILLEVKERKVVRIIRAGSTWSTIQTFCTQTLHPYYHQVPTVNATLIYTVFGNPVWILLLWTAPLSALEAEKRDKWKWGDRCKVRGTQTCSVCGLHPSWYHGQQTLTMTAMENKSRDKNIIWMKNGRMANISEEMFGHSCNSQLNEESRTKLYPLLLRMLIPVLKKSTLWRFSFAT
jgi:hypothetical protein